MRHRVEAATVTDDALLADLEALAHDEMARGAWSSAVSNFLAASRLSPQRVERERLALEAIEALMYAGDGAAARRLAEQTDVSPGPRRDSVWAYLAIFAGDLEPAQHLLERAWEHRALAADERLSATIAQRRAFLATCRLRSAESIEWAERAVALAPARHRDRPVRGRVAGARAQPRGPPGGRARRARSLARRPGRAATRQRLRPARAEGQPADRRWRPRRRARRRSRPRRAPASRRGCWSSPRCRCPGSPASTTWRARGTTP